MNKKFVARHYRQVQVSDSNSDDDIPIARRVVETTESIDDNTEHEGDRAIQPPKIDKLEKKGSKFQDDGLDHNSVQPHQGRERRRHHKKDAKKHNRENKIQTKSKEEQEAIDIKKIQDFHEGISRRFSLHQSSAVKHQFRLDPLHSDVRIRWKRGELLGQGQFGKVYLALNLDTGQLMAVKQIELVQPCTSVLLTRITSLEKEVEVLKSLRHPHIVRYIGTFRGSGLGTGLKGILKGILGNCRYF